jgi:uncharacterized membrane protein YccC
LPLALALFLGFVSLGTMPPRFTPAKLGAQLARDIAPTVQRAPPDELAQLLSELLDCELGTELGV